MARPRMPWLLLVALTVLGVVGGALFGVVRGLGYLPTLPFAIVEGAVLFGVPAALLGLLLSGAWWLVGLLRPRR
ncbi:MAG: hypothetical protein ACTHQ3_05795 [Motilibacteraceae bacterium]